MKLRTIKRHLLVGLKNIYRNGWMSIAAIGAVTVTLILVGTFLTLMLNLNQMTKKVEQDVVINTHIDLLADENQIKVLGDQIKQLNEVESVIFSSKDEELQKLNESMDGEGGTWEMFEQDNPLNHVYIVKAKDPNDTLEIAKKIKKFDNVEKVVYGEDVVQNLLKFNKYARTTGLVLIAGLVFTAIFLISNTIKLTIMARSEEIGIMKLVGATNGFIRWPFFIEGMFLGILGSFIPIAVIVTGYYYLESNIRSQITFSFVELLPFNPFAWQLSLVIIGIGAIIGIWGSVMSIRKFLKV